MGWPGPPRATPSDQEPGHGCRRFWSYEFFDEVVKPSSPSHRGSKAQIRQVVNTTFGFGLKGGLPTGPLRSTSAGSRPEEVLTTPSPFCTRDYIDSGHRPEQRLNLFERWDLG